MAVYGDSNCLDSSHQRSSCFGLLQKAIQYVAEVRPGSPAMDPPTHGAQAVTGLPCQQFPVKLDS